MSLDARIRRPTVKVLEKNFESSFQILSQLLKINAFEISDASEARAHAVNLKLAYKHFASDSRNLSSSMVKCGAMSRVSELNTERHALFADCSEIVTVVNSLLNDTGQDALSNLDNISYVDIETEKDGMQKRTSKHDHLMSSSEKVVEFLKLTPDHGDEPLKEKSR